MSASQVEDTKILLNLLQNSNFKDNEHVKIIQNFKDKYSLIATERILNYHLNNCINGFIKTIEFPCKIKDSQDIITAFSNRFGFTDDKSIEKLIEKINWNTNGLNLSTIHLIPTIVLRNFKPLIVKEVKESLLKILQSQGIRQFKLVESEEISLIKSQVASLIPTDEFDNILKEQHMIFMTSNIFDLLLQENSFETFQNFEFNELLMNNMVNSIKKELFNIRNSTEEIIFKLKELIPKIRELDPSGYVVDCCLKEAQTYFKHFRKDLNEELLNFLLKHKNEEFSLKEFEGQKGKNNPFALEYPPQLNNTQWKPDPIFIKSFINPEMRTSDPINLIISHFSANNSLAENYQKKIAERLLKVEKMEEVELIVEEVEILRIKCGDNFVTSLNIMINDIIESKGKSSSNDDLKVTIISHRYWPEFDEKDLEHPESISERLKAISSTYSRQFEDKKIIWRPKMDEVSVELEFNRGGTVLFTCPIEAAIFINSFEFPLNPEDEEFDLSISAILTGISDKNLLKRAINFWLKKRVIIPSKTSKFHFKFAQEYDQAESDCVDYNLTIFDSKESETFADDSESSDSNFTAFEQKYWPIISNMFKTFGQISAERIQSTLKMYSKEYKESLDLLTKFLQNRVRQGTLQSNGNRIILYSLNNK